MNPVFEASNFSINQMAKGVLPVPPTFKLPMTNEGTDAFVDLKIPTENKILDKNEHIRDSTPQTSSQTKLLKIK